VFYVINAWVASVKSKVTAWCALITSRGGKGRGRGRGRGRAWKPDGEQRVCSGSALFLNQFIALPTDQF